MFFIYIIQFNPYNNSDVHRTDCYPYSQRRPQKMIYKDHIDKWQKWPWHLGCWVSHGSARVCVCSSVLWQKNGTFCLTWYLKTRPSIPGETISVNTSFQILFRLRNPLHIYSDLFYTYLVGRRTVSQDLLSFQDLYSPKAAEGKNV